jgi:HAD superfamily hydrolase (TIGR01490 family)
VPLTQSTDAATSAKAAKKAAKPKKMAAAFFDVDNTLVRGSTTYYFARMAYTSNFFKRTELWRFAWQQFRFIARGENAHMISHIKDQALALVKGRTVDEMMVLVHKIYDQEIKDRLWPETVRLAQQHIKQGREVWLITAAPQELGDEIAKNLGLTGAMGTRVEHKDGKLTGNLVGKTLHGKEKRKAIRKLAKDRNISLRKSFAYSDSHNDLPMLTAVGHAVAVNPDKLLKIYAKSASWKIYDFKKRELRRHKKAQAKKVAANSVKIGKRG